jgi:phenylacetate-CoA ligase
VALVEAFGHAYEQLVLVGDPLFMKKFTDHARERGIDWSRYRVNAIIGEEVFGEHFRGYLAACLGLNPARPDEGYVMSSFGVGELGLHLCHETPATIGLRRATLGNPAFARDLLGVGDDDGGAPPMIFTFDPLRTFIEVVECDANGYGRLTISMLDPERSIPLLRYQTGDLVRLLDGAHVAAVMSRHSIDLAGDLPSTLLALKGREKDALPNGPDRTPPDRRVSSDLLGRSEHDARPVAGLGVASCVPGRGDSARRGSAATSGASEALALCRLSIRHDSGLRA